MVKNGKRKLLNNNDDLKGWKIANSIVGPSTKMTKTSWAESDVGQKITSIGLNSSLTQESFIRTFSKCFQDNKQLNVKDVKLLNDPFQVAVVNNFLLNENMIPELVEEMGSIEWTKKQMDLYEFYQSTDLANVSTPYISKFYNFITNDLKTWMEQLTGMKFQKISATCSMYNCTNFLLSHDDLLSDRLIAYVLYLSPWKGALKWNESMGGALEIFGSDNSGQPINPASQKIFPANNQFTFFKVHKRSHHQVGEVLAKDYPRLSIHGWFHGYGDNVDYDSDAVKIRKPNVPIFRSPIDAKVDFKEIINKNYLKEKIKADIQKQIEENSEAGLGEFLTETFFDQLQKELTDSSLKWSIKGPANQQNYEILNSKAIPKSFKLFQLLDLVASKQFLKLLHEYTELDLYGTNSKNPKCSVEFQRWKGGCYGLLNDPSTYSDDSLDLVLNIGCNDSVGTITYLVPDVHDNESDDDDSILLTIYPQNNFLNLVFRSAGTAKFTKYCYKSTVMETEFNYILSCSYKE